MSHYYIISITYSGFTFYKLFFFIDSIKWPAIILKELEEIQATCLLLRALTTFTIQ